VGHYEAWAGVKGTAVRGDEQKGCKSKSDAPAAWKLRGRRDVGKILCGATPSRNDATGIS